MHYHVYRRLFDASEPSKTRIGAVSGHTHSGAPPNHGHALVVGWSRTLKDANEQAERYRTWWFAKHAQK